MVTLPEVDVSRIDDDMLVIVESGDVIVTDDVCVVCAAVGIAVVATVVAEVGASLVGTTEEEARVESLVRVPVETVEAVVWIVEVSTVPVELVDV